MYKITYRQTNVFILVTCSFARNFPLEHFEIFMLVSPKIWNKGMCSGPRCAWSKQLKINIKFNHVNNWSEFLKFCKQQEQSIDMEFHRPIDRDRRGVLGAVRSQAGQNGYNFTFAHKKNLFESPSLNTHYRVGLVRWASHLHIIAFECSQPESHLSNFFLHILLANG